MLLKTILLLTLSVSSVAVDKKMLSKSVDEFWSTTKLVKGEYTLKSGPKTCQRGTLRTEINDDKDFTLMLGGHGLVLGLGNTETPKQSGESCHTLFEGTFKTGQVKGEIKDSCDPINSTHRLVEVTPTLDGFTYHRIIKEAGTVFLDEKCELVPASAGDE